MSDPNINIDVDVDIDDMIYGNAQTTPSER